MREVVCAAIFHESKVLLVRKKQTWILPGGKPEGEEPHFNCLEREILKEEIPDSRLGKLTNICFYKSFEGKSPHVGDKVRTFVYFADFENYVESPKVGREIAEAKWVNNFTNYNLSKNAKKAVESLIREGYL